MMPPETSPAETRPFRILSLDGGGIRGYYTAKLLAGLLRHFETRTGRTGMDLGKGFDLISGTSTGGILASALALGKRPETIAELYRQNGPAIFPERFPKFRISWANLKWAKDHWKKPTGAKDVLREKLQEVLGDKTLENLWIERQIALTLPSISIETYGPKVFKTPHLPRLTHDRRIKLVDACLASSAAPLYFPLHAVGENEGYYRRDLFVDGGLWANNPSLVGLLEGIEILAASGQPSRDIHIFSLGTCSGTAEQGHLRNNPEGGLKTWKAGKEVTELAITTSANAMNFMTKLLAEALSAHGGRKIIYARIPDPEMTSEQQSALGLDKADPQAFEIMDQLAASNEARILSSMASVHDSPYRCLEKLFSELPLRGPVQAAPASGHQASGALPFVDSLRPDFGRVK